jgi:hypothetical protein
VKSNLKRILIFAGFVLFASYCNAQDTEDTTNVRDFPTLQIGVSFSPNISYRSLSLTDPQPSLESLIRSYKDRRDTNEIPVFGFNVGAHLTWNIIRHVGLSVGFQYSQMGIQSKMKHGWVSFPDPNQPIVGKYIYKFAYLDVPVRLTASFGRKKVRYLVGLGVEVNFLQSAKRIAVYTLNDDVVGERSEQVKDTQKFNATPFISAGIDISLLKKLNLRIEPNFRFGTFWVYEDISIASRLWSAGLSISIHYGILDDWVN